jgi:hypothetical protein
MKVCSLFLVFSLFFCFDAAGGLGPPGVDVEVNGEENGVQIYTGVPVKIDYAIQAGFGAGIPVDVWLVLRAPLGLFSYEGSGPSQGWHLGPVHALFTGPLADMAGTALNHALPIADYNVYLAIDTVANGVPDMGSLYAVDTVDFDVIPAPQIYRWDDGSTEGTINWTVGGEIVWMNRFTTIPGGETILDVRCIYGSAMYAGYSPPNGTACEVYVWDDPTNDHDPSDCVLLSNEPTTVQNVDTDIYNIIPLSSAAPVNGEFYVGCRMPHAVGQISLPIDDDTPYLPGTSWFCGTDTLGAFDPGNLMNNLYPPSEYTAFFCIRAGY